MKYGIVIIFYNPDEEAIRRIKLYSDNFYEVLIVDNSENKNIDIEQKMNKYKNCLYHKMNGNEGMAKALNYAFYRAIEKKYDFIVTMDQDSVYTQDNIRMMKCYIEKNYDERVGIYSPNYSKMYFDKKKNDFVVAKPVIDKKKIKNVYFCMTSGSFVNVRAVSKVLPLEDYFISYVDNYLCVKLIENNYKLLMIGESYFSQQIGGKVENTIFNRLFRVIHHSEVRYYYMFRNNMLLQKQIKNNFKCIIKYKIELLRIFVNIIIGENEKQKKLKACIAGYRDFKKNIIGKVPKQSIIW